MVEGETCVIKNICILYRIATILIFKKFSGRWSIFILCNSREINIGYGRMPA